MLKLEDYKKYIANALGLNELITEKYKPDDLDSYIKTGNSFDSEDKYLESFNYNYINYHFIQRRDKRIFLVFDKSIWEKGFIRFERGYDMEFFINEFQIISYFGAIRYRQFLDFSKIPKSEILKLQLLYMIPNSQK